MVDISSIKSGAGNQDAPKKVKAAKFKLTKAQKLYVEDLSRLENRIAVCREFIKVWMEFFRFFAEDLAKKEITPQEEKGFFQVMTQLARKQFLFVEVMANCFDRGNDIMKVLDMAVSLAHIQNMQENTLAKLQLDWHALFLDMNKALGRLLRQLPGNMTLSEALDWLDKGEAMPVKGKKK